VQLDTKAKRFHLRLTRCDRSERVPSLLSLHLPLIGIQVSGGALNAREEGRFEEGCRGAKFFPSPTFLELECRRLRPASRHSSKYAPIRLRLRLRLLPSFTAAEKKKVPLARERLSTLQHSAHIRPFRPSTEIC